VHRRIFTLGHSRHPIERFIGLAKTHGVALIVDVRGRPFSRFNPQFNRERFRAALAGAAIDYAWMGETLSGRPEASDFYGADGEVLWDKLRGWPPLRDGLADVLRMSRDTTLALVCAEEDPLRCHRRFLLTPPLATKGADVVHVRGDGRLEGEADVAAWKKPRRKQKELFE
jgi:uncharacterized protein (DUF488 family)